MRTSFLIAGVAASLALPAAAQTATGMPTAPSTTSAGAITSSGGSITTSRGAITSSAGAITSSGGSITSATDPVTPGVPDLGRPDPIGTQLTLSQSIDNAAGLNTRRAIINGTAGSLPPEANRVTGNTVLPSNRVERAGRPAGAPLGSGRVAATPTPSTPPTVPAGLPAGDPRHTAN